ncbi:MAG: hypothetical protein UY23_C0004G0057 [Candidatus Jorgensenbacteria bacterium GW2011_GWA1_48_11]|uniref:Uncharacterized protein n=1 Tax=Candidatus Jorgensenbacteria bacterium GW2011_GWA1_48_11 TaxID=1618660 RepID=A0A0G1UAH9_9BACT|nr:MAG: hypothetical protein UY23_C0004G0057 [Candidatus Jorgensenbacteria bacterium GW2011_GWA1_48_11]KKW11762.1 MAG: hypothetical protein UY51_C0005G0003 [Candidatus Jorgensenbacteria bacterium GW2011_GWB1_49_9]
MPTTEEAKPPLRNINRRQEIIARVRAMIKTSKSLAEDVSKAMDELEQVSANDGDDLLEVLDFIEDLVHKTADAELREKILGIRQAIDAHPNSALEQLRWLV